MEKLLPCHIFCHKSFLHTKINGKGYYDKMYLLNRLPAAIFVRRCSVCLPCLLSVIPVSISCFPYCPSPSFCITPSCRSLALQGKPGDVAMGGVYVLVHPPQPCHAPPSTSRICRRSYIKMAIILPMTATKMIYPKMILCAMAFVSFPYVSLLIL